MQVTLQGDGLHVTGFPPQTVALLLALNGVKCYEENNLLGDAVRIPMKDKFYGSDMLDSLPACRGGSLQVYAVDGQRCVLAMSTIPNFCYTATKRGQDITSKQRLLASSLRTANEVHRWEFPIGAHTELRMITLRVLVEAPGTISSAVTLATVCWSLAIGERWGTLTSTTIVDHNCLESVFLPIVPEGVNAVIQCEVASSPNAVGEIRYAVYHDSKEIHSAREPQPIPQTRIPGRRMAILVGVSKYTRRQKKRMSDLEYADDDVVMWYTFLRQLGYECKIFGDEFSPCPGCTFTSHPATIHNGTDPPPCETCDRLFGRW